MTSDLQLVKATTALTEVQKTTQLLEALQQQWGDSKIDSLEVVIKKSRLSVDQAPPEGLALCALLGAWAEVLDELSPEQVREYYLRASKQSTNGFPVNAKDIRAEWNRLADYRRLDVTMAPEYRGKY